MIKWIREIKHRSIVELFARDWFDKNKDKLEKAYRDMVLTGEARVKFDHGCDGVTSWYPVTKTDSMLKEIE